MFVCVATMQPELFSFPVPLSDRPSCAEGNRSHYNGLTPPVNFLSFLLLFSNWFSIGQEAESVKGALTASRMGDPDGKLATIFFFFFRVGFRFACAGLERISARSVLAVGDSGIAASVWGVYFMCRFFWRFLASPRHVTAA